MNEPAERWADDEAARAVLALIRLLNERRFIPPAPSLYDPGEPLHDWKQAS